MRRTSEALLGLSTYIYAPPPQSDKEKAHARWLAAEGDKTLRLDYPLDPASVVFDLGGYEGQWASDIFSKYLCSIHVFEPVPDFAIRIARRFAANKKVKVHPHALGSRSGLGYFVVAGNRSSTHLDSDADRVRVSYTTVESVIAAERIEEIHLMKINIEGGEYELLEHLIETGVVTRIQRFQIQFHDFVANADERMSSVQRSLSRTHRATFQFPFVWEGWVRKDLPE